MDKKRTSEYPLALNTFAMIFLVRIFEGAVSKRAKNEISDFIIEQLLDFFVAQLIVSMIVVKWNMPNSFLIFPIC